MGAIKADERGGAEAGAVGEVSCFDVGSFWEGAECESTGSNSRISSERVQNPSPFPLHWFK